MAANQPAGNRNFALAADGLNVAGWIGAVKKPNFLKAEDGDNFNRLAVFMRGKVAQEDLLGDFGFKEIFADYVVGEVHCDDLDQDDGEDIATSVLPAEDDAKRELLKASILAFESYRWKEQLDFLGNVSDESVETVLRVFKDIADLERSYYGQIAKGRLRVIDTLEEKLDADEKERIIHDHIYENLWLLDPSWDIVEGSQQSERRITTFLQKTSEQLTDEERKARIDIGYRTAAGAHVIIELKRASVRMPIFRLMEQITKYRNGVAKLIPQTDYGHWPIEVICLMGQNPTELDSDPERMRKMLATIPARVVLYDELLGNARRAYADYLEQHKKIDRRNAAENSVSARSSADDRPSAELACPLAKP